MAYDGVDARLGQYFANCKTDLLSTISMEAESGISFPVHEVESKNCRLEYLELTLGRLKDLPFVMIAYTHGTEDSLVADGAVFLRSGQNHSFFAKSFLYTTSCLAGKKLGPDLIEQGCRVFIGYEEPVIAFKDDRSDISLKCDNLGMTLFLTSDITAFDAYKMMKSHYSIAATKQLRFGDPLASGLIISSREALVFHGDMNATRRDFQQSN